MTSFQNFENQPRHENLEWKLLRHERGQSEILFSRTHKTVRCGIGRERHLSEQEGSIATMGGASFDVIEHTDPLILRLLFSLSNGHFSSSSWFGFKKKWWQDLAASSCAEMSLTLEQSRG